MAGSGSPYSGTLPLLRQGVRRDRILLGVWALILLGVVYASATATSVLYTSVAERVTAAEAINGSPAIVALYGPVTDVRSEGELAMTKLTVLYAVFVALLVMVVVRRHTRTEEESGRAELVGGTAVGRDALTLAAVLEGTAVSIVIGVLAGVLDIVGGLPVAGSLAFGATWVGIGLVGTGLTAVACQLSASTRTCAAIASAAIGGLFVLRAIGDTSAQWLSWLSPFGWNTQLHAWAHPRWWVLLLYVALTGVLLVVARQLVERRDLGSGLFPDRPGPAHGAPRLADVLALNLKLHAPMLAGWTVATAVLGVLMGSIVPSISSFLDSPSAQAVIQRLGGEGALQDAMVAALLSIFAVIVTCFGITVVTHGGHDEHEGRTEEVLATATSRSRQFLATALVAGAGVTWLLLVNGAAVAVGYGIDHLGPVLGGSLAQAPAVWLVLALVVAAYAAHSRWAVFGWGLLALFVTVGQLGEALRLPRWLIDLSPYVHTGQLPGHPFPVAPALTMTALAVALVAVAWARFRARDIG